MTLSIDDIRKLALLARLDLSQADAVALAPQFEQVLSFVDQLGELDTQHVEPMTTAVDVVNRWADDVATASLGRDAALANSPSNDGECFLVPPVLGPASGK